MVHQAGTPSTPKSTDLVVVQHGNRRRTTITIALDADIDQDIIAAINKIQKDKRQDRIRNAIRDGMPKLKAVEYDNSVLMQQVQVIHDQVIWMGTFLETLRDWLSDRFSNIGQSISVRPSPAKAGGKISEEQRKARMQAAEEEEY
jgi:hypothetical protein